MQHLQPVGRLVGAGVELRNARQMRLPVRAGGSVHIHAFSHVGLHDFLDEGRMKMPGLQRHQMDRLIRWCHRLISPSTHRHQANRGATAN